MKIVSNAIYVFSLTFVFYVAFFSGVPQTSDEDLYLSAARNIVDAARLDAPEVYGSLWLQGDYHGVEPAHPVLASFWFRFINVVFPDGRLQSLYLLPILYTSLAAGLLVILAVQLNYSLETGVAAGVLFGLSTIAWPYAKTFYRETLAVALIPLVWVIFEETLRNRRIWVKGLLAGVSLLLLTLILLTKVMLISFVLSFIIMLIIRTNIIDKRNVRSIFVFASVILAIAGLVFLAMFKIQVDKEVFYRFTTVFIKDAIGRYLFIDHKYFWEAIIAPLISPWKGFFIYSPICFMAFPSFYKLYKKKQTYIIIVALVTLVGLLATQALAYDREWWTTSWSVRYLLPCIPLFVIAGLPWLEEAIKKPCSPHGVGLIILFGIGMFIQLGAVIINPSEYNWKLFEKADVFSTEVVWSFSNAPILGQWSQFLHGVKPDLAIWRSFENENAAYFFLSTVMLFLAWLIFYVWTDLNKEQNLDSYNRIILSLGCIVFALAAFVLFYHKDAYYHSQSAQIKSMCNELKDQVNADDIVLIKPYRSKTWFYFMNSDCIKYPWYSLPYNIEIKNNLDARSLTTRLLIEKISKADRVWLVNQIWSEPDELRDMLQHSGYSLKESQKIPFDNAMIIFDLYIQYNK